MAKTTDWIESTNRFVAFFDILGFKDMVSRQTHEEVLEKLKILKARISQLESKTEIAIFKNADLDINQTKTVTFSDSIIVFSKGGTFKDAVKILFDSYHILKTATYNKIGIKGSISFGKITVDFDQNLFFGQPIIDSYLLHDELQMLTVIIDNTAEVRFDSYDKKDQLNKILHKYKAVLKTGKVTHKLIKPFSENLSKERILKIEELYLTASGKPRVYFDNTIDFLKDTIPK